MPSRRRQLALACALLLAVHAGAAGVLWANGAGPDPPEPRTASPDDDPRALLAAAVHNSAAFASTSEVRFTDPRNGTTLAHARVAVDPDARRAHMVQLDGSSDVPLLGDELYAVGWGRWHRAGDDWEYHSRTAAYGADDAMLVSPPREADAVVRRTSDSGNDGWPDGDGNATVTAGDGDATRPAGERVRLAVPHASVRGRLLSIAGVNATLTYTVAFHERAPYVQRARGIPSDERRADGAPVVHVRRTLGATVERPDALGPYSPSEVVDRLLSGARYG